LKNATEYKIINHFNHSTSSLENQIARDVKKQQSSGGQQSASLK
jgi:hypothetical protein